MRIGLLHIDADGTKMLYCYLIDQAGSVIQVNREGRTHERKLFLSLPPLCRVQVTDILRK